MIVGFIYNDNNKKNPKTISLRGREEMGGTVGKRYGGLEGGKGKRRVIKLHFNFRCI